MQRKQSLIWIDLVLSSACLSHLEQSLYPAPSSSKTLDVNTLQETQNFR